MDGELNFWFSVILLDFLPGREPFMCFKHTPSQQSQPPPVTMETAMLRLAAVRVELKRVCCDAANIQQFIGTPEPQCMLGSRANMLGFSVTA